MAALAQEEMGRIDAVRVVAAVTDEHVGCEFAVVNLPRQTMGLDDPLLASAALNAAIAERVT